MNNFKNLEKDLADWMILPRDGEAAEKKIKCELRHGMRVRWYYKEDAKFAREEKFDPRKESQYTGIIVAKPDIESGLAHDLGDFVLVIDSYPCEKENARVDYVALNRLMDDEEIVELFEG